MRKLRPSLETSKNRLQELEKAPSADQERARLRKKLLELSKKRVKISQEYTVGLFVCQVGISAYPVLKI